MVKVIFFDFDGVILDSMPIRDYGFKKIFKGFPQKEVDDFLIYHNNNGGLSRFHKIEYFYNNILKKTISKKEIEKYANEFSEIMKNELINKKYLISDTLNFIRKNNDNFIYHIVSGSEQNELRFLCKKLDIDKYFKSIEGSPIPKNDLVKNILDKEKYKKEESILIGDSINDYEAASINGISFFGFNNEALKNKGQYLDSFINLEGILNGKL